MITLTHCGKLGDFIATLPVASGLYNARDEKIHFVLPKCFKPFTKIESLLALQPFFGKLTLVDYPVQGYWCGGQPYHFDPKRYGVECDEYYNLGFRGGPNKPIWQFVAEEYDLGWDSSFNLKLESPQKVSLKDPIKAVSDPWILDDIEDGVEVIDEDDDILTNVMKLINARESYVSQSGPFHIMDMAGYLPTKLFLYPHCGNIQFFTKNLDLYVKQGIIERVNRKVRD